jgi:hypothetical protein
MVKLFQTHFFVASYAVLFIAKCCSLHEEKIAANVMTCSNYPLVLFFDFSYLDA